MWTIGSCRTADVQACVAVLVACSIRQQLLQQGQHLTKACKLWSPSWQSTAGWAPEMG